LRYRANKQTHKRQWQPSPATAIASIINKSLAWLPCTMSGLEMERAYSHNPGASMGHALDMYKLKNPPKKSQTKIRTTMSRLLRCSSSRRLAALTSVSRNCSSSRWTLASHTHTHTIISAKAMECVECDGLCVCLSVTTITKKIVDGVVPNFMGRFLGGKGKTKFVFRYDR